MRVGGGRREAPSPPSSGRRLASRRARPRARPPDAQRSRLSTGASPPGAQPAVGAGRPSGAAAGRGGVRRRRRTRAERRAAPEQRRGGNGGASRPRLTPVVGIPRVTCQRMAIEDKDTATDLSVAPVVGPDDPRRFTDSGIEVKTLYTSADLPENLDLGQPGEFPYTRGVHAEMYRKRRWTMRQYAGYASAKESNERYKYLLAHGSTGLSMAFDLPTQLGLDSDDPRSLGEVGRTGVAIDTLDDMRTAFDGIPLDEVSTSMTINAPAAVLLLLYELVAEEQGIESQQAQGHGAERHPQGVHRPRELHLPAGAEHAADHGPVRLLQGEHPEVEHGQHLRLPLPREGRVGGPGGRVHARERHGLRAGRARRRPAGGRLRAPPGLLLQRPQQRLPGGREVPRGPQHVGARDARALRGEGPEVS